jgi:hypothetical protein
MKLRNNRFLVLASTATMTAVCLIFQAGAQTTWIGNTDNNLNNALNWSAGVPTGSVNSIFSAAGSSGNSLSLTSDLQFVGGTAPASNGMLFDGAGFTITGNSATRQLTIGGQGLAINTANTITIDVPRVRRNASNTFEFLGSSGNLVINGDFSTNITTAADTTTRVDFTGVSGNNNTITFNGNIVNVFTGGAGAGLGNLTISSAGTGNKVVLNNTSNIGVTGAVSIGNNAQLHLGSGGTKGTLAGSASISLGNTVSAFVINQSDTVTQGTEFASAITGAGKLEQRGAGTTILNSTTGYTGGTIVSGGKLIMGDATADTFATSSVTVENTATLGGSGTISGTAAVQFGGIHSVGAVATGGADGVGKQTFTSTVTYSTGSIFEWNLAAVLSETGRGTSYDAVNAASLGSTTGAIFRVVLNDTQDFTSTFWDSDRTWSDIFKTGDAGSNLSIASIFSGTVQYYNGGGTTLTSISDPTTQGAFTFSGTDLKWTAVPEPTSALAGLLVAAGLLRRRRSA